MAGKLWIGRSILRGNFSDFLNGIYEAEKSERSWDNFIWELREFWGKIEENIII
jgi:hypothetical protein